MNKYYVTVVLLGMLLVGHATAVGQSGYYELPAIADARVQSSLTTPAQANTNYGTETWLRTQKNDNVNYHTYIKFDLSGVTGTNVTAATLRLFRSHTDAAGTVMVYSCNNDSWIESGTGGITFNNKPPVAAKLGDWVLVDNLLATPHEIDITDWVTSNYNGNKLVTVVLLDDTSPGLNQHHRFRSRENEGVESRPKLIIEMDSVRYSLSGRVAVDGVGLEGVLMAGLPGNPITGPDGTYSASIPSGWSGTATPTLWGYIYDPESRTYTDVQEDYPDQDYDVEEIYFADYLLQPFEAYNFEYGWAGLEQMATELGVIMEAITMDAGGCSWWASPCGDPPSEPIWQTVVGQDGPYWEAGASPSGDGAHGATRTPGWDAAHTIPNVEWLALLDAILREDVPCTVLPPSVVAQIRSTFASNLALAQTRELDIQEIRIDAPFPIFTQYRRYTTGGELCLPLLGCEPIPSLFRTLNGGPLLGPIASAMMVNLSAAYMTIGDPRLVDYWHAFTGTLVKTLLQALLAGAGKMDGEKMATLMMEWDDDWAWIGMDDDDWDKSYPPGTTPCAPWGDVIGLDVPGDARIRIRSSHMCNALNAFSGGYNCASFTCLPDLLAMLPNVGDLNGDGTWNLDAYDAAPLDGFLQSQGLLPPVQPFAIAVQPEQPAGPIVIGTHELSVEMETPSDLYLYVWAQANAEAGPYTPVSGAPNSNVVVLTDIAPGTAWYRCEVYWGDTWEAYSAASGCGDAMIVSDAVSITYAADVSITYAASPPAGGVLTGGATTIEAVTGATEFSVAANTGYTLSSVVSSSGAITNLGGGNYRLSGVTANTAVTAYFTVTQYQVTFDLGEHGERVGGGALQQLVAHGGAAIAPQVNVITPGLSLSGWSIPFDNVTSALYVVAVYDDEELYPVTFNLDGKGVRTGGGTLNQYVLNGTAALAPVVAALVGWSFVGWDASFDNITGPLNVTALYEPVLFSVTFNLDGKGVHTGGGSLEQIVQEGQGAVAPAVTGSTGWSFIGWDTAFGNVTGPLNITALYEQVLFTVVFDLHGKGTHTGGGPLEQTIIEGQGAIAPEVSPLPGWIFLGWNAAFDVVTASATITARFRSENLEVVAKNGITEYIGYLGQSVTFEVVALNAQETPVYWWYFDAEEKANGTPLGDNLPTLTIGDLDDFHSGEYWCVVEVDDASVLSPTLTLTVVDAPPLPALGFLGIGLAVALVSFAGAALSRKRR